MLATGGVSPCPAVADHVRLAGVDANVGRSRVPVWLLDVDGVINVSKPGWVGPPSQGMAYYGEDAYQMRWSPRLVSELRRLHSDGTVEFRWATTWADHVDQIEALLRLPRFSRAFSGLDLDPNAKAPGLKVEAALHVIEEEGRPLIWTDDDAIPFAGPLARRLRGHGVPLLLVTPDPRRGLRPAHLRTVAEFLADPWSWGERDPVNRRPVASASDT